MMANDVDPDSAAYSMLMKSCHLDLILLSVNFSMCRFHDFVLNLLLW